MSKIITRHVFEDIIFDQRSAWRAFHDGDQETAAGHIFIGFGATEAEALADLALLDNEWSDMMEAEALETAALAESGQ